MNSVKRWAISAAWRFARATFFVSSKIVPLLYHGTPGREGGNGVSGSAFERHLRFLKENFDVVDLRNFDPGAPHKGPRPGAADLR
jgi:hypothetical protein